MKPPMPPRIPPIGPAILEPKAAPDTAVFIVFALF